MDLLGYPQELDFNVQRGIRSNHPTNCSGSVCQIRRDDQLTLAADLHSFDPFIPTGDHLARTKLELKRHIPIERAVELSPSLAVYIKPSCVMNLNGRALGRSFARADFFIDIFQSGFCCCHIPLREHTNPKSQNKECRCEYVFHP